MAACSVSNNCFPQNVCINVPKIFDQCRLQLCLTKEDIGPARLYIENNSCGCSGCSSNCGSNHGSSCGGGCQDNGCNNSNPIVVPPANAVSVTVDNFKIKDITVINKQKSKLCNNYWNIAIKFTFVYNLTFYNSDSCEISCVKAYNNYTAKTSLYGGDDIDKVTYNEICNLTNCEGPFVSAEASAIALAATLNYGNGGYNDKTCYICCPTDCKPIDCKSMCAQSCKSCSNGCNDGCDGNNGCGTCNSCVCTHNGYYPNNRHCPEFVSPCSVDVTIGLFAVIKLLRYSNICVKTYGNCIPEECENKDGIYTDPCEFFNSLEFPTNLFAPQSSYAPIGDTACNSQPNNVICCG